MMTPKKSIFVKEYLIDLNATQAAIRCGYSEKTAYSQGQRLLKDVEIQKAIQAAMDKRSEKTEITAEYILNGIKGVIQQCESEEKYNAGAALKGYELLGKHLKLFADRIEHDVAGDLAAVLQAARRRIDGPSS